MNTEITILVTYILKVSSETVTKATDPELTVWLPPVA